MEILKKIIPPQIKLCQITHPKSLKDIKLSPCTDWMSHSDFF